MVGVSGPADPAHVDLARVLVEASAGPVAARLRRSGAVAERLDLPYVELDALFHGPGWMPVMAQLVRRTVRRRVQRTELWNGNIEPPLRTVLTDPDHILRWAWRTHPRTGRRIGAAQHTGRCPPVMRLGSRVEVRAYLARVGGRPTPGPGAGSPTPPG